jgi:hypothetical protein
MTHELGHALGLFHEQSRPDRDDYVTVLTNNINPAAIPNFDKSSSDDVQTYGIPYDYGSVMHYALRLAFKLSLIKKTMIFIDDIAT